MRKRVFTMVCHRDVPAAVICLKSLIDRSADPVEVAIFDDGTLDDSDKDQLRSVGPGTVVVDAREADEKCLDTLKRHPACLKYRRSNLFGRKTLDMPLAAQGDFYYIDSDIYFFRPFRSLFTPDKSREDALFMQDLQEGYSVRPWHLIGPRPLKLASRINSGIICLRAGCYDLDYIEYVLMRWGTTFEKYHGWWADQTCWAALAGRIRTFLYDPEQIPIMQPGLEALPSVFAVHFVSTFRHLLFEWAPQHNGENAQRPVVSAERARAQRCSASRMIHSMVRKRLGL